MTPRRYTYISLIIFTIFFVALANADLSDFKKCNTECSLDFISAIHNDCDSHDGKCYKDVNSDHKDCVASCKS